VDNTATGANNGTSWANAWPSFSAISWSSIAAGDTIYISGGATSQTYTETWTVGAGGTAGSPITIAVDAADSNHNGTVIFDYTSLGSSTSQTGISIAHNYVTLTGNVNGASHIQVNNLYNTSSQTSSVGVQANSNGSTGVTVDYITFNNDNNPIRMSHANGDVISNNTMLVVRGDAGIAINGSSGADTLNSIFGNHIELHCNPGSSVPTAHCNGPDGIQTGGGASIYNNFLSETLDSNISSGQHPDMFQIEGSNVHVFNNEIVNIGDSGFDFDCFSDSNPTDIWVYNNVYHIETPIDAYPEYWRMYSSQGPIQSITNVRIMNNTYVDDTGGYNTIRLDSYGSGGSPTASNFMIANNLFYNDGGGNAATAVIEIQNSSGFTSSSFTFSNNLYYNPSGAYSFPTLSGPGYIQYLGCGPDCSTGSATFTTANWISTHEPTGTLAKPTFVSYAPLAISNDFHLAASDTAATNAGANLSQYFNIGKDGNARPATGAWDIGAYQGTSGAAAPNPPTNLTVTSVQ